MNFSELLTEVRTQLQEPTAAFWSDTILKSFINEGDLQVCKEMMLGDPYRDTVTVADQSCYTLPDYAFEVHTVLYGDSLTRLKPIKGGPENLKVTSGTPSRYWLPDGAYKFYLDPIPEDANVKIRLCGRFKSSDMSDDTDEPETPVTLQKAIVHFACMKAWTMRKDGQQSGDHMALYKMALQGFSGHISTDGPKKLIIRDWSW